MLKLAVGILAGRLLGALAQAGALVLLARALGVDGFAVVASVLGVAVFLAAILDLGTTTAAIKAGARDETDVLGALRTLNTLLALVSGSLLALGLTVFGDSGSMGQYEWLLGLGLWLWMDRIAEFNVALTVGRGQATRVGVWTSVRKVLPLLFVIGGVVVGSTSVLPAYVVGSCVGSAVCAKALSPVEPMSIGKAQLREAVVVVRFAAPYWVNSMAAQSRQLDVVLAGAFGGPSAAASYAPAGRLITPLRMLPTSIAQSALAVWAKRQRYASLNTIAWMTLIPAGVFFGGAALVAGVVVPAALGPDFASSVAPLRIVLCGLVPGALASMLTSYLQARGCEWRAAASNAVVALVGLALIAAGAALGGASGAAFGVAIGLGMQSLVLVVVASSTQNRDVEAPRGVEAQIR